jgi:hypothetical protein
VHPYALGPEFIRQIAADRFQRRLHRPHDIVVRHDSIGPVIAHRKHRAAFRHERRRELRHPDEGMAGNVHRLGEAFGRAVQNPALKTGLGSEGDRVNQNIESTPFERIWSNIASSCPGMATSTSPTIDASSSRASGSTCFFAFSLFRSATK